MPLYSRDVAPLLDKYCMTCHAGADAESGVDLLVFRDGPVEPAKRSLVARIADNLRSESMPPGHEPQPDTEDLAILLAWIDSTLTDSASPRERLVVRRLNRAEYNNTVRDLVGLETRPADEFPADDVGYGFDNIAEVLSTPTILVEMYQAAATKVVDEAFLQEPLRQRILTVTPDSVPLAFRRYTPAVRTPRGDKVFKVHTLGTDPELARQQHRYDILRTFCDRAFRRPATHDELSRLLALINSAERDGEAEDEALRLALSAVLTSSRFLFIGIEVDGVPDNDFSLASRISYFLWSSMPDEELYRLAARKSLREPVTLRAQVSRMLRDRRSRALAENFASQWLQTRKLDHFTPDKAEFPDYDPALMAAMLEETVLFFDSVRVEDRPLFDLLDSDYTFANDRLGRHYGLSGIEGAWFRRVSLAGTPRGGVLTQASVLAATSNPTRTSPVKRGKWILENILGAPPAPPPSGVEALREGMDHKSATTLRQKMARHRADAACASCHRRMDPLGFALENFDAIGAWRSSEGGLSIDATGQLPGGRPFQGPSELKAALMSRRKAFARCLTEKLMTYALGRGLDGEDHRHIDDIVARLDRDDYRMSALITAVVESEPFLQPRIRNEGASR
jgi:hypothetical protein